MRLILLALMWGTSFMFIEIALANGSSAITIIFFRVLIAGVVLVVWLLSTKHKAQLLTLDAKTWLRLLILSVLSSSLPFFLISWGQQNITSGLASIFNSTTAIFGVLVASLVFTDERLTLNKVIGVLIGMIGIIITVGYEEIFNINIKSVSQWAVVSAAFCYGLAGSWTKKYLYNIHWSILATTSLFFSTIIILLYSIIFSEPIQYKQPLNAWLAEVSLAIFGTTLAYRLYFSILKSRGAGYVGLVTILIPVVAIFFDILIFGEHLIVNQIIGFIFIILALMLTTYGKSVYSYLRIKGKPN